MNLVAINVEQKVWDDNDIFNVLHIHSAEN